MDLINDVLDIIFKILGLITIIGTIVAHFTKTDRDDKLFAKIVGILPTLGTNPVTKKLKDKLKK